MSRSDTNKRRRTSKSLPERTDWSQNCETSPESNDPALTSTPVSRGQFSTHSAECSPTAEGLESKSVPAGSEGPRQDNLDGGNAASTAGVDEIEGQDHHSFNYLEERSFYKMASLSSAFQTPLPPQHLGPMQALRNMLITGEFSDMIIKCGTKTYHVHRMIVFSQSPVLAHLYSETKIPNTLEISAEKVSTVTKMLEYYYTNAYSIQDIHTPPTFGVFTHIEMHALAVKYNIRGLMVLAATNFAYALRFVKDLDVYFQSIHEVYSQRQSPLMFGRKVPVASPLYRDLATSPNATKIDTTEAREEMPNASLPADGMSSPEALALRAEVVDVAILELNKILAKPLVVRSFHQVCMEVKQFHLDFLGTLAAERAERVRGRTEKIQEQGKGCRGAPDDATVEEKGVGFTARAMEYERLLATRHGDGGAMGAGVEREGSLEGSSEGERGRSRGSFNSRDGSSLHGSAGSQSPRQDAHDNSRGSDESDVIITHIRCEACGSFEVDSCERKPRNGSGSGGSGGGEGGDESGGSGQGYEIQVICSGCGEACQFKAWM